MRPIKFRAWDKISKCWAYDWVLSHKGIHSDGGWSNINAPHETTDRYILMQLTGLKDKNSVEIFEGDIIEFDIDECGKPNRWIVKWDEESGRWDTSGGNDRELSVWTEVIGNIHQNPELLEKS